MAYLLSSRSLRWAFALALGLSACDKKGGDVCGTYPPSTQDCLTTATVRDLTGFDGCGKVLELANGKRLEPHGTLWTNFHPANGQRVIIGYQSTPSASICMVGEVVEITCIRANPN